MPLALTPLRTVAMTFGAFGIGVGLWSGGSAALIARAGVSPATFGVTLTVFTAVYLFGMSAASTFARIVGLNRVVIGALLLGVPLLALVLTANGPVALIGGLVSFGLAGGLLDAGMNAQAVALEKELRRPIMARLHGVASGGVAASAVLGSLIVTGPSPWIAAVLGAFGYGAAAMALAVAGPADPARAPIGSATLQPRVMTRSLVVIGLVVGVSIVSETATLAWSAPLLRAEAPALAAIAGLGGAFFAGCQALLRFNADALRHRISDRTLIAVSLGVAAGGLVIAALPLGFAASVLGFAIVGFGTAAIVPCGFALAASRPGVPNAAAISAVAFFGLFSRVPAPVLTGVIAEAFSLSVAFVAIAALLALAMIAFLLFVPATPREAQT